MSKRIPLAVEVTGRDDELCGDNCPFIIHHATARDDECWLFREQLEKRRHAGALRCPECNRLFPSSPAIYTDADS